MCFVEDGPSYFDDLPEQHEQEKIKVTTEQVQQLKAADSIQAGILLLRDGVRKNDYRTFTFVPFETPEGERRAGHYMASTSLATYQNEIYPALIQLLERFGTKEGETTREFPLHAFMESTNSRRSSSSDPFGYYVNTYEYLREFTNVDSNKTYICVSNCLNTPEHFPTGEASGSLKLKISIYSVPIETLREMRFYCEADTYPLYWYELDGDEYLQASDLRTWNGHYVTMCNGVLHIHGWAALVHGHCAYWSIKSMAANDYKWQKAEEADNVKISFTMPIDTAALFYMENLKNLNPMSTILLSLAILLDKVWWLTPVIAIFLWAEIHDYKMRSAGKKSSTLPQEEELSETGRTAYQFLTSLPKEETLISQELLPAIKSAAVLDNAEKLEKELSDMESPTEADKEVLAHLREAINFAMLRRPSTHFGVYILIALFVAFIAWLASDTMQYYLCAAYVVVPIIFFLLTLSPNYKLWEEKNAEPAASPEETGSGTVARIGVATVLTACALASRREYTCTVATDGCGNQRVVDKQENVVTTGTCIAIALMILLFAALCVLLSVFCGIYFYRNYLSR